MVEQVTLHNNAGNNPSLNNNIWLLDDEGIKVTKPVVGTAYRLVAKPFNMVSVPINVTVKFYFCKTGPVGTTWADYEEISFGQTQISAQQSAEVIASKKWTFPQTTHTCLVAVAQTAEDPGPQTNPNAPYSPSNRQVAQYNLIPVAVPAGASDIKLGFNVHVNSKMDGKVSVREATEIEMVDIVNTAPQFGFKKKIELSSFGLKNTDSSGSKNNQTLELSGGEHRLTLSGKIKNPTKRGQTICIVVEYEGSHNCNNESTFIFHIE